jgi:HEAT repeat protein
VRPLVDNLRHPEPWVRELAAQGLAELGSPEAEQALLEALADHDEWVRRAALGGLAAFRGAAASELLQRGLTDPSPLVRHAAVQLLGELGTETALEAVTWQLTDPDADVRREVAATLARVGQTELLALVDRARGGDLAVIEQLAARGPGGALLVALEASFASARAAAAAALGQRGDPRALPALEARAAFGPLAVERVPEVRAACGDAIRAIAGAVRRPERAVVPATPPDGEGREGVPTE